MRLWSSIRRELGRLRALPREARRELPAALLLLTLLPASLRLLGLGRTCALLERVPRRRAAGRPAPAAARLRKRCVDGLARRLPWRPRCLPRALALHALLRRAGLGARLRLGVRKAGAGLAAHAWVECAGEALEPAEAWAALPALRL